MSEFILAFAEDSERHADDVSSEMRRRFPDEEFLIDITLGRGDKVIPIQGTVGSAAEPGRMRPVSEALLRQIKAEFAMVLLEAKARKLQ